MPILLRLPVAGRHLFFLLLSGILALFSRPAAATHIVGGELDLQYQSGNTYRITLNLYFDALNGNPGALDQDLTVSIFEKGTNRRMQNLVLPLTSNTFVAYTNPACTQPTLSTRSLIYSRAVELPAATYNNPAGYYAAVERCCRNNGINNIVQPGNAGQTFYLEFPAVVRNNQPFINSTPRIFPPLSDYAYRVALGQGAAIISNNDINEKHSALRVQTSRKAQLRDQRIGRAGRTYRALHGRGERGQRTREIHRIQR